MYLPLLCVHRCLSSEKQLEPDASPMELIQSPDIAERTNSGGCSVEAVYSGNFSVTVADDGETALVVSTVKGDECLMKPSDTTASSVQSTMDGDPDRSHLEICCRRQNTEQVPGKLELMQSLPHDIPSELPSDSKQTSFSAKMENIAGISIEQILNLVVIKFPLERRMVPVNVNKCKKHTVLSSLVYLLRSFISFF